MATRQKKFIVSKDRDGCINVEETLFNQRHIFINDQITCDHADQIVKNLLVLDMMENKPIQIYITSPGGRVDWGFAIIDVMKQIRSKCITIATGQVCSMGTLIAIAGDERKCFKNTSFMFHDMFSGVVDYSAKMKARLDYTERLYNKLESHIVEHTKLTKEDIDISRSEELWIFAEDAVEKGLVDSVIGVK